MDGREEAPQQAHRAASAARTQSRQQGAAISFSSLQCAWHVRDDASPGMHLGAVRHVSFLVILVYEGGQTLIHVQLRCRACFCLTLPTPPRQWCTDCGEVRSDVTASPPLCVKAQPHLPLALKLGRHRDRMPMFIILDERDDEQVRRGNSSENMLHSRARAS